MRKLGGGFIALLVWLAALALPVVALPSDACAAGGPRAALVVDTGQAAQRFCVSLPTEEVSGLELIALAGEQHGLTYRFGYGGAAVCMLADVGTTGDDCFERYPDFWGYWRGGDGGWTWSSTGAGNTTVTDGDVEGWSWGSGSDGSSHPRPPETSFASVCPVADQPRPAREPSPAGGSSTGKPRQPARASGDDDGDAVDAPKVARVLASDATSGSNEPGRSPRRNRKRPGPEGDRAKQPSDRFTRDRPAPTPGTVLASDAETQPASSGVPAAGVVALGLAAGLGLGGFVIARRRRGRA